MFGRLVYININININIKYLLHKEVVHSGVSAMSQISAGRHLVANRS